MGVLIGDRDVERYAHTALAAMAWRQAFTEPGGDEYWLRGDEGRLQVR